MSLPDRTTVLIVGAGPTGLASALSLIHHDFRDFVIVDALPQGRNLSRSMLCQPASLEVLDTVGCADDIIAQGLKSMSFNIETRSTRLCSLTAESLRPYTRYPYNLTITQNIVERTLEKKLASFGVIIHRPMKVVGLACNAKDSQFNDVTFEDGKVITARYVIAADGSRSAIRTMTGIGFSDPTREKEDNLTQMLIADVTFDNSVTDDPAPRSILSPNGTFYLFPLPSSFNESVVADGAISMSEKAFRIGCGVPLVEGEIPKSPSKEYIQTLVDRFGPYFLSSDPTANPNEKPTRIKHVIWSSRFRTHASIADTTFVRLGSGKSGDGGVVILVGDAAHINSPAGGQGLNLGVQDGIFLGDALTKHIRATEAKPFSDADVILHEFAAARHARALEVIKLTKRILALEGLKYRERMAWWLPIDSETFRTGALWLAGHIPFIVSKMAWDTSGLSGL